MAEVIRGALKRPARAAVEAAIRAEGGNLTKTAARLHATRQSLYTWIYQLGLERLAGVRPATEILKAPVPTNGTGPVPLTIKVAPALARWVKIRAIQTDATAGAVVTSALELLRAVVGADEG